MAQEQISTAYLVIQQGPQVGKRVELCKDCTTIGRSRDCDIFLEDVTVHRKQASILYTDRGYILRDDQGSGDSLVNGRPEKEHVLKDGDQLLFGNTRLIFYSHEATRPFQLSSSRGRESRISKRFDPNASAIARLELSSITGEPQSFELQPVAGRQAGAAPHARGKGETVEAQPITIGRSRDCSIFLEDLAVSRLHATIRQLPDGEYELEDEHSATGTFINGRAVMRSRLHEGDIVVIGSNTFTFRRSTGPAR